MEKKNTKNANEVVFKVANKNRPEGKDINFKFNPAAKKKVAHRKLNVEFAPEK